MVAFCAESCAPAKRVHACGNPRCWTFALIAAVALSGTGAILLKVGAQPPPTCTVWLQATEPSAIRFDPEVEARHFAGLQGAEALLG